MTLLDLKVGCTRSVPPADVRALLREATKRIRRFQRAHRIPAFVASDYQRAFESSCNSFQDQSSTQRTKRAFIPIETSCPGAKTWCVSFLSSLDSPFPEADTSLR